MIIIIQDKYETKIVISFARAIFISLVFCEVYFSLSLSPTLHSIEQKHTHCINVSIVLVFYVDVPYILGRSLWWDLNG